MRERIFVNLFTNIGDAVNFTPLLRWLRNAYPTSTIVACTGEAAVEILSTNQHIDDAVLPPRKPTEKLGQILWLRRSRFSMALMARNHNPTILNARLAGIRCRIGFQGVKRPGDLTDVLDPAPGWPRVEGISRAIAMRLGIETDELGPELGIPPDTEEAAERLLSFAGISPLKPIAAFHCGASQPSKIWPIERMRRVWEELAHDGVQAVLVGGKKERPELESEIRLSTRPPVNFAGDLDLMTTAAILRRADILVSNDSGPMHMAAAVGTPVVAMFGPTLIKDYRPWGEAHRLFQANCRCEDPKVANCGGCIAQIEAGDVLAACRQLLS